MKIIPINDNILVLPEGNEEKVVNGIIIPELGNNQPQQGTIVAVGNEVTAVKENDKVLYTKFSGQKFVIDKISYLTMSIDDIVAILQA